MKLPPLALVAPSLCPRCGLQLHRCGSCHGVAGPFDRYCGFCGHELVRGEERAPYWRLWMLAGLIPLIVGLVSGCDLLGQWRVDRVVRVVLLAREEPQHRAPALGPRIPDGPEQRRVARLERVENRALRHLAGHVQLDGPARARKRLQVSGQHDLGHDRVCTSTDSTAGRSRTTAFQLSPSSADA